jgi:hypothetical protein
MYECCGYLPVPRLAAISRMTAQLRHTALFTSNVRAVVRQRCLGCIAHSQEHIPELGEQAARILRRVEVHDCAFARNAHFGFLYF